MDRKELIEYVRNWIATRMPQANVQLFKNVKRMADLCSIIEQNGGICSEYGDNIPEKLYNLIHNQTQPICEYCKEKPAKFISLHKGYKRVCPGVCGVKLAHKEGKFDYKKQSETFKKNFGKGTDGQKQIRIQIKETSHERYGTDHPSQSEEVKENYRRSSITIYGVDNPMKTKEVQDRVDATNHERYGGNRPLCDNVIKLKMVKSHQTTMTERYGVKFVSHVPRFFEKIQNGQFIRSHFKDLHFQQSFEEDFIKKYYDIVGIQNGKSIWYEYKNEKKLYYSDFYIESKNLIVEIKSEYYYRKFRDQVIAKALATLKLGYNFIIIIDKDYDYFEKYMHKKS